MSSTEILFCAESHWYVENAILLVSGAIACCLALVIMLNPIPRDDTRSKQ